MYDHKDVLPSNSNAIAIVFNCQTVFNCNAIVFSCQILKANIMLDYKRKRLWYDYKVVLQKINVFQRNVQPVGPQNHLKGMFSMSHARLWVQCPQRHGLYDKIPSSQAEQGQAYPFVMVTGIP